MKWTSCSAAADFGRRPYSYKSEVGMVSLHLTPRRQPATGDLANSSGSVARYDPSPGGHDERSRSDGAPASRRPGRGLETRRGRRPPSGWAAGIHNRGPPGSWLLGFPSRPRPRRLRSRLMEDVERLAEDLLNAVPAYIWDGDTLPIPIEEIADSHVGLLVRDVDDLEQAPGAPT